MIIRHESLPLEYNTEDETIRWTVPGRGRRQGWFVPKEFIRVDRKLYRYHALKKFFANYTSTEIPPGVSKLGLRWKAVSEGEYLGLFKTLEEAIDAVRSVSK